MKKHLKILMAMLLMLLAVPMGQVLAAESDYADCTVTITAGDNGAIEITDRNGNSYEPGTFKVKHGTALNLEAVADEGYVIDEFKAIHSGYVFAEATGKTRFKLEVGDITASGQNYQVTFRSLGGENTLPVINAQDKTLTVGDMFDELIALEGVTAEDLEDGDLSDKIVIKFQNVDTSKAGQYMIIYQVADSNGGISEKTIKVTVKEKEEILPENPEEPAEPNKPIPQEEIKEPQQSEESITDADKAPATGIHGHTNFGMASMLILLAGAGGIALKKQNGKK